MSNVNTTIGSDLGFNTLALPKRGTTTKDSNAASSSDIGFGPLASAFTQILEQSINGLTAMAAQVATKRVEEFAEGHDAFRMFFQAAGWAPADSSSSSSSSSSSNSSSASETSSGSNPISILLSALGQEVINLIENSLPDSGGSEDSSSSVTKSINASDHGASTSRSKGV